MTVNWPSNMHRLHKGRDVIRDYKIIPYGSESAIAELVGSVLISYSDYPVVLVRLKFESLGIKVTIVPEYIDLNHDTVVGCDSLIPAIEQSRSQKHTGLFFTARRNGTFGFAFEPNELFELLGVNHV